MAHNYLYKGRDAFGNMEVTEEYLSAAFFKNHKYEFSDIKSIVFTERDASRQEKLAPFIGGGLFFLAAIGVFILNQQGYFCWGVLALLGLLFLVLALATKKMMDIVIEVMDGTSEKENLPANERSREFIRIAQKAFTTYRSNTNHV